MAISENMSETYTVFKDEPASKEDRVAFLQKKNEARKRAAVLDWEKDKAMSFGGKPGYRYLSIDKMKRNLLPVFMSVGLDFKLDYKSIEQHNEIGAMSQHWTIVCEVTLTDVDTGYSETTTVFGESGDSGDKAIGKASTYALKTWLADTFMLIDGIDPDADSSEAFAPKVFTPKTDKEQDEIKSKAFSNGIKPNEPAKPAEPESEPAPQPSEPKPAAPKPAAPKAPAKPTLKDSGDPTEKKPATEKKPGEVAIEKLKEEAAASFKPTVPQQNMINNILARMSEKAKAGKMSNEEYETFTKELSELRNNSMAVAFIKKYREA